MLTGELQRQVEAHRLIRERLEHPKNAVPDHPISLKRNQKQEMALPDSKWTRPLKPKALPKLPKPNPDVDWWTGRMTPAMVLHRVAEYYYGKNSIKEFADLTGCKRAKRYVVPRQIYVYLCFKHIPEATCSAVARPLHKDHTTVIYSRSAIALKLGQPGNGRLEGDIRCIEALIYAGNHHSDTAVPALGEWAISSPEVEIWHDWPADVSLARIQGVDQRSDSVLVATAADLGVQVYPGPIQRGFALLPSSSGETWGW